MMKPEDVKTRANLEKMKEQVKAEGRRLRAVRAALDEAERAIVPDEPPAELVDEEVTIVDGPPDSEPISEAEPPQ